jgi:hypothetical protein
VTIKVIPHHLDVPDEREPVTVYRATVELLVEVGSESQAYDAISEGLRDIVVDWRYVELPIPDEILNPHIEGDF